MNKEQLHETLKNRLYGEGVKIEEITIKVSNPSEDFECYNFIKQQWIVDNHIYLYGNYAGIVNLVNWNDLNLKTIDSIVDKIIESFHSEENATFKIVEGIEF